MKGFQMKPTQSLKKVRNSFALIQKFYIQHHRMPSYSNGASEPDLKAWNFLKNLFARGDARVKDYLHAEAEKLGLGNYFLKGEPRGKKPPVVNKFKNLMAISHACFSISKRVPCPENPMATPIEKAAWKTLRQQVQNPANKDVIIQLAKTFKLEKQLLRRRMPKRKPVAKQLIPTPVVKPTPMIAKTTGFKTLRFGNRVPEGQVINIQIEWHPGTVVKIKQ